MGQGLLEAEVLAKWKKSLPPEGASSKQQGVEMIIVVKIFAAVYEDDDNDILLKNVNI